MTTKRRLLPFAAALLAAAVLAPSALADGGPLVGIEAGNGATAANTPFRFITFGAGRHATVLARVNKAGGTVDGSRTIRGSYGIPAVAYDGTGGGVAADGSSLVLVEWPRAVPARQLRMKIVDTTNLRTQRTITLHGTFSFDAISPDGLKIYLVKYRSPRNLGSYAVRAYDVAQGRLLAHPVVDRLEPDERMRGVPLTRATSSPGDWAYTLYDGAGDAPFVHALNTAQGVAYCIDLDALAGHKDLFNLKLGLNERLHRLTVSDGRSGAALLHVDTRSWKVTKPAARHAAPPAATPGTHDGGPPIWLIALGAAALALVLLAARVVSRRRSAAPA